MIGTPSEYLAHSANRHGKVDPLRSHLEAVSSRAAQYASAFGASEEARLAGLFHDLGKYGDLFQRRLQGQERGVDHWSPGAWAALMNYKQKGIASAVAIQGHHIGLQTDPAALGELNPDRLRAKHPLGLRLSETDCEILLQRCKVDGLNLLSPDSTPPSIYDGINTQSPAASMLDIRMLYSALVDADFIETEGHFHGESNGRKCYREEGPCLIPEEALSYLRAYLDELAARSEAFPNVNRLRADLLKACLEAGTAPHGAFTLTAPTGTGKTLSMLSFALSHAMHNKLRRVIVVVPYLTIIEQTVREYRKALAAIVEGEEIDSYVLEHHSLSGIRDLGQKGRGADPDMEDESWRRARLLAENWDAPIIVTTSVQLLESLFSNRPSACRKLHRLASSVILFDEVQTLPASIVVPTLATLSRLTERYRTTIVLATATQPAFTHLDAHVRTSCKVGWQPKEIVPKALNLFERAKRTTVVWPDMDHPASWTEIAQWLIHENHVLCVVNLKKHALRLVEELRQNGVEGIFHLSTSMCPAHRTVVLGQVRERLMRKEPCRLISTQCVEAGVDLDFPIAYRAFGPLDAIAQVAGRCNRNGSAAVAMVHVFLPEDERYPDGTYDQAARVTRMLLKRHGGNSTDIHDPELFKEYFREFYDVVKPENRKPELLDAIKRQDFACTAELYRVIEKDALNVLVPYDLNVFRQLEDEVRQMGLNRKWIDKARPYTIGLFRPKPYEPISAYLVPVPLARFEVAEDWFIYAKPEHYHQDTGLVPPEGMDCLMG